MTTTLSRLCAGLCACILVSACANAPLPQSKIYVLDDLPDRVSNDATALIAINKIELPDYLNQRKLVLRQLDQQILIANYHIWGDDLPDSIRRVLAHELSNNGQEYRVVNSCSACGELTIRVDHFYPTDSGEAVLAGSYTYSQDEAQIYKQFSFKRILREDGYDEAVYQMRQLLLELSNNIAVSIAEN